jgi:hypothetical protein
MREHKEPRTENHSLISLIVGSVSSAAAAVVVNEIWRPGTILGAAATPVLMALFAEALRRPAERVTLPAARISERGAPLSHPSMPHDLPVETVRIHRSRPRWRAAVLTGLMAFLLGAAGLTASELLLHHSVAGGGHRTTLLDSRPQHPAARPTQSVPGPQPERSASEASREERRPHHALDPRPRADSPNPAQTPTATASPTPVAAPTQPPASTEPAPTSGDPQPTLTSTPPAAPPPTAAGPNQPEPGG